MTLRQARAALQGAADPRRAIFLRSYFKTGPGEYGEGDVFIRVTVPALRTIAKRHRGLPLRDLGRLLRSSVNEARALAGARRASLFKFYMRHRRYVNNWNLVDGSAPAIVGPALAGRNAALLDRLATSGRVWDRRIAVLSTFHLVKRGCYGPTLRLCRMLRRDPHDLIHKACGWMLREVGKRDPEVLERFLRAHHTRMPRTMLRYATERLPAAERRAYLRRIDRTTPGGPR